MWLVKYIAWYRSVYGGWVDWDICNSQKWHLQYQHTQMQEQYQQEPCVSKKGLFEASSLSEALGVSTRIVLFCLVAFGLIKLSASKRWLCIRR